MYIYHYTLTQSHLFTSFHSLWKNGAILSREPPWMKPTFWCSFFHISHKMFRTLWRVFFVLIEKKCYGKNYLGFFCIQMSPVNQSAVSYLIGTMHYTNQQLYIQNTPESSSQDSIRHSIRCLFLVHCIFGLLSPGRFIILYNTSFDKGAMNSTVTSSNTKFPN